MKTLKNIFRMLVMLILGGAMISMAGCQEMEDAGEETGEALEEAGDATMDAAEEAGDEMEDAADEVEDEM